MTDVKLYLKSNTGTENSGVETDVTFNVVPPLSTNNFFDFTLTLESAEIPISFYNINSDNNTFIHTSSGGTDTTLTIPIKNYRATGLVTALNTVMTALAITTTYDEQTNKFTFTHASSDFSLKGNAFRVLGLLPTVANNSTSNVLVSPNMINLMYPRNAFLKLISTQDTTYNKTIAKVQLSALEYEVVYFSGTVASEFSLTLTDKVLSTVRVAVVNDEDEPIGGTTSLNGIPWSIGLKIKTVPV